MVANCVAAFFPLVSLIHKASWKSGNLLMPCLSVRETPATGRKAKGFCWRGLRGGRIALLGWLTLMPVLGLAAGESVNPNGEDSFALTSQIQGTGDLIKSGQDTLAWGGNGASSRNDGGLIMGIGAIGGAITNGPGDSISAGNEIGVLNLGNLVWFGGATNRWDLADATGSAGTGWDLLNIAGTLTLWASASDKAIIDVTSFTLAGARGLTANFDPTQNYLWTIAQTSGGIYFSPGNDAGTVFDLLTGNFHNDHAGGEFAISLSADGRQLNLSYTYLAVPEPGKITLLGLGLFSLVYLKRIKRNWGSERR